MILRGQVRWAELSEPRGSEPGYARPVVVQSNAYNRSELARVLCVALSTNLGLAAMAGNLLLRSQETGLHRDSVANVTQVIAVDKAYLGKAIGQLPDELMFALDNGLRRIMDL